MLVAGLYKVEMLSWESGDVVLEFPGFGSVIVMWHCVMRLMGASCGIRKGACSPSSSRERGDGQGTDEAAR